MITVGFGLALDAVGLRAMYATQQGAVRVAAASDPAFLGGFAMIGIFAALVEFLRSGNRREFGWIGINLAILLATGARAPLRLAAAVLLLTIFANQARHMTPRMRAVLLTLGITITGFVLIAMPALGFVRVIALWRLGEAGDLSNRTLIWPAFEHAIIRSPWLGWGVGAGKVIVPLHFHLGRLLGTNAAHNEYLRIAAEGGIPGAVLLFAMLALWLWRGSIALPPGQRRIIRLVFLAFAVQSVTDNTLIATTSLAFFTWARALFDDRS